MYRVTIGILGVAILLTLWLNGTLSVRSGLITIGAMGFFVVVDQLLKLGDHKVTEWEKDRKRSSASEQQSP